MMSTQPPPEHKPAPSSEPVTPPEPKPDNGIPMEAPQAEPTGLPDLDDVTNPEYPSPTVAPGF